MSTKSLSTRHAVRDGQQNQLTALYYYYLFITPQRQHIRTQHTKHVKSCTIKLQQNYKYAAKDAANACVTAPFILSLVAVDLTPYLLHRNTKSEETTGKHIKVLSITFIIYTVFQSKHPLLFSSTSPRKMIKFALRPAYDLYVGYRLFSTV